MKQELIWELMKQAGELAYEEHKTKCLKEGLDPEHTVWSVTGAPYEKFAELIVGECMKLNHEHFNDEDPYSIDSLYRQHFGFKE